MSITLELSPETEARLRADAQARGIALETLAAETLSHHYDPSRSSDERRAAIARLRGRSKGPGTTVDDFLAERSAEGRKEAGL